MLKITRLSDIWVDNQAGRYRDDSLEQIQTNEQRVRGDYLPLPPPHKWGDVMRQRCNQKLYTKMDIRTYSRGQESETNEEVPETCILWNDELRATPLVANNQQPALGLQKVGAAGVDGLELPVEPDPPSYKCAHLRFQRTKMVLAKMLSSRLQNISSKING